MSMDALSAANAYRNQLKMLQDATTDGVSQDESGPSFSKMVENALSDTSGNLQKSENLQLQSMTSDKVDLADLVTAVANAELSLNTVVAIRDRVINAYNDIIKMGI